MHSQTHSQTSIVEAGQDLRMSPVWLFKILKPNGKGEPRATPTSAASEPRPKWGEGMGGCDRHTGVRGALGERGEAVGNFDFDE